MTLLLLQARDRWIPSHFALSPRAGDNILAPQSASPPIATTIATRSGRLPASFEFEKASREITEAIEAEVHTREAHAAMEQAMEVRGCVHMRSAWIM